MKPWRRRTRVHRGPGPCHPSLRPAEAVIFTWVFNSTRGSLLVATLLHASINASTVCLPVLPAATGDQRTFMIILALRCLVAVVLVAVFGPARLTRSQPEPATFPGGANTRTSRVALKRLPSWVAIVDGARRSRR